MKKLILLLAITLASFSYSQDYELETFIKGEVVSSTKRSFVIYDYESDKLITVKKDKNTVITLDKELIIKVVYVTDKKLRLVGFIMYNSKE